MCNLGGGPILGQQPQPLPRARAKSEGQEGAFMQKEGPAEAPGLALKDEELIHLFLTACFHEWDKLPDLARACYAAGCTVAEVRGCIRHMCV